MKTKLTTLVLFLSLSGLSAYSVANENKELSKADLDKITAECKQDSQDAENPAWYAEECVAERVQALKEELGLAQPEKEES